MGAAILRFLATLDPREEIAGPDTLAEIFIPEDRRASLREPMIRQWAMKNRIPPGMYEFMIARTAFFDQVVQRALREDLPQIVFLGAGYDSRSYRFKGMIRNTRIFELDIQPTQQHKTGVASPGGHCRTRSTRLRFHQLQHRQHGRQLESGRIRQEEKNPSLSGRGSRLTFPRRLWTRR